MTVFGPGRLGSAIEFSSPLKLEAFTLEKFNYLEVDNKMLFTKPNVDNATKIDMIHEYFPISFSEKVFFFKSNVLIIN